mgnify:CR=1 FL=1
MRPADFNRGVACVQTTLRRIESRYARRARAVDYTDGLSLDFGDWRFNLRGSNTEPLLRLNVESRADRRLTDIKTSELLAWIDADS